MNVDMGMDMNIHCWPGRLPVYVYLPAYLSVFLACQLGLSVMPVCLSACLHACLPVCLPLCLSVCLFLCLSVCLFRCFAEVTKVKELTVKGKLPFVCHNRQSEIGTR